MIVVKIELWPMGVEEKKKDLSRLYIANTGSNPDPNLGDYKVAIMKKGVLRAPWEHGYGGNKTAKPFREGEVKNHPRITQHVIHLVRKAIDSIY